MSNALTQTTNTKSVAILRIIAGLPLLGFGVLHLIGVMPMKPLVEAAGLPMPGVAAMVTPPVMILAGVLLIAGLYARVGAVLAIGTMLGAVVTHIKIPSKGWPIPLEGAPHENPYVPMLVMAIAIILFSGYVVLKGAGAWSVDGKQSGDVESPAAPESA